MKSYIDFFETLKGEFVGSLKFKNKFVRLWGTTSIDGVEVLNKKFIIYPGLDNENTKKILKLFGSSNDMKKSDFKGVKTYYFWLNAKEADILDQENIDDILAGKINSYCAIGEKLTINLNFSNVGDHDYFKNFTKEQILSYVQTNYDSMYNLLDNYAVGDTLLTTAIGTYILFDNGQHFNIEIKKAVVTAMPSNEKLNSWDDEYYTVYKAGISLQIIATRLSNLTSGSDIVMHIKEEQDQAQKVRLQQLLESDSNESIVLGEDWIKNRGDRNDYIWYKNQMRTDFILDPSIKNRDKLKILISAIDTGYTVPSTPFWKKIIGPVLIVAAIVLAVPSGGLSLEVLPAFLAALAINVGIAVLIMTGLQIYWAKNGDPGAASYMGRWIRIGSVISMLAGIASITMNIARQAATQTATKTATETAIATGETSTVTATSMGQTVTVTSTPTVSTYGTTTVITEGGTGALIGETATVGFGDFVSAGWNSMYSGMTSSWQSIVSTGLKMVRFFTNMRFQSQAKSLQSEINAKTEQNDKASQELEEMNDKEVNIAVEDIKWYTSPLKLESQRYDVDYLYGGTRHNIGRPSFITGRGSNIISNDVFDVNKI